MVAMSKYGGAVLIPVTFFKLDVAKLILVFLVVRKCER